MLGARPRADGEGAAEPGRLSEADGRSSDSGGAAEANAGAAGAGRRAASADHPPLPHVRLEQLEALVAEGAAIGMKLERLPAAAASLSAAREWAAAAGELLDAAAAPREGRGEVAPRESACRTAKFLCIAAWRAEQSEHLLHQFFLFWNKKSCPLPWSRILEAEVALGTLWIHDHWHTNILNPNP
jgi:hypothetical protein